MALVQRLPLAPRSNLPPNKLIKRPRSPTSPEKPISTKRAKTLQTPISLNTATYATIFPTPTAAIPSTVPISQEKQKKREIREAQQEEFRNKYTKAFPNWHFYFDTTQEVKDAFLPRIGEFGGHHATFFSGQTTHVIVMHRPDNSNKENATTSTRRGAPKNPFKASKVIGDPQLVAKATEMNMKVWDVAKLDSVLSRITTQPVSPAPPPPPAPRLLQQHIEAERRFGVSERDPYSRRPDFDYFEKNSCFILVEDMTGQFAPIASKEYPTEKKNGKVVGDWPVLYLDPRSRSPFIQYNEKEERKRQKAEKAEQERRTREAIQRKHKALQRQKMNLRRSMSMANIAKKQEEFDELPPLNADSGSQAASGYIAASGNSVAVASTTGTTSTMGLIGRGSSLPAALKGQIRAEVPVARNLADVPHRVLRKSKSTNTMRLPRREEDSKPGFCESCRHKFECFKMHVKGKRHQRFAQNDANFLRLDVVLARVARRTLDQAQRDQAAIYSAGHDRYEGDVLDHGFHDGEDDDENDANQDEDEEQEESDENSESSAMDEDGGEEDGDDDGEEDEDGILEDQNDW
ncbi:hypothetical protein SISSUDRAFT_1060026 [Sistotremastrum suecicum HHB10207 ss-3]|uniref:DBF4-type domain-containing protein n=1 Tax=Sistotremastrum suecicum HHB10207 ss-3 TaxID=1314776 RepID=A0A166FMT6_9AGAM|nr:hypothetical protein SISSUDRAFT_1060026 [Sistotremastrum suecicum HHB10207 ss-3]